MDGPFLCHLRPQDQARGGYTRLELFPFDRTSPVCVGMARPYEGTIVEMAQSTIEQGMV
jgi:hypothetical protein